MMDIDEELSLQIKAVFEDFDDGRSEMGWGMLLDKYQEQPSRRFPIFWVTGIAAMLAIVAGLWVFFDKQGQKEIKTEQNVKQTKNPSIKNNGASNQSQVGVKLGDTNSAVSLSPSPIIKKDSEPHHTSHSKNNLVAQDGVKYANSNQTIPKPVAQVVKNETNKSNPLNEPEVILTNPKITSNEGIIIKKGNTDQSRQIAEVIPKKLQDPQVVKNETNKANPTNDPKVILINPKITSSEGIVTKNGNTDQTQQIAQASQKNKIDSAQKAIDQQQIANKTITPPEPTTPKITTEELLIEQSKLAANKNGQKVKEKKIKNNKNSYEVFTGTFLNYYGNNEVKVNAGFGLNANLKVSNGLFLSVGAGISQNKISYQSYSPNTSKGVLYDAVAPTYSVSSGGSTNMLQTGYVSNTKLNAQLLSLDLPIILKFYPTKKQTFYLSTGFNSNSYFAQKYDYTYTVTSTSAVASNIKSEYGESEKSKFKGFDLANSAIFAIGFNQKIGKTNMLIFEPYFKPAIGNMGDKNLKINSAGLNLKFSFGQSLKK
jgi:predicted metalloprotease